MPFITSSAVIGSAFHLPFSLWLQQLMPFTKCIVATGGGAVISRKNWGFMQHGVVIWLDGSPELLASHVVGQPGGTKSRPLIFSSTDVKEQVRFQLSIVCPGWQFQLCIVCPGWDQFVCLYNVCRLLFLGAARASGFHSSHACSNSVVCTLIGWM